jgi:hypothetical protein
MRKAWCVPLVLLAIRFTSAPAAPAQTAAPPPPALTQFAKIKSADLLSDLKILRSAYEQLHPGLYRYNSKAQIDTRFTALEKEFNHDLTLQQAYVALSAFAADIRCGHTYPNFFNQKKEVAAALFQGNNRAPFYFRWISGKLVVIRDFTPDHSLPRGTQVFSINGNSSASILKRLMTVARADGSNDAKRVAYLEVNGDSKYEAFDIYFPMFFPQHQGTMQLVVRRPGEQNSHSLAVPAVSFQQRLAVIKDREEGRKGGDLALFEWKYLPDGSAYLRMPTWAMYESKWDWKTWLNTRLDELSDRNPHAFIIDLRGNEGGNDVGNEILARLVSHDLKLSSYRRLVRYRSTPEALNPYLDTWDPSFRNWGDSAVELPQPWPSAPPVHYFALKKFDDDDAGNDVIRAGAKSYRGQVYVLIDANNSSATFQFERIVQQNRLGTLVGQPTGGNQRGINGGAFFFLRLPKSQIEMDLPLVGTFPDSPQPDAGLTPDVVVVPALADIAAGTDVELTKIEELERRHNECYSIHLPFRTADALRSERSDLIW